MNICMLTAISEEGIPVQILKMVGSLKIKGDDEAIALATGKYDICKGVDFLIR